MNKTRRKEIRSSIAKLHELIKDVQAHGVEAIEERLSDVLEDVEYILSEEECYKDNMPENLQNGVRYERAEEACDSLDSAVSALDYIDCDDTTEDAIASMTEAIKHLHAAL